jgi:hypothetical protein
MLVSTSVPNLINGVTQQADNLRFPSQCDEQVNSLSSVTEGLTKRPPTNRVAKLQTGAGDAYFTHINRDAQERYLVTAGGGLTPTLKAFTLEGVEVPIKNASGNAIEPEDLAYLASAQQSRDIVSLTVSDHTFFVNRSKTVAMTTAITPTEAPQALIMIKQVRQGANYSLNVYQNPNDGSPTYVGSVSNLSATSEQGAVAAALWSGLNESGVQDTFYIFYGASHIWLQKKDGSDFRVEVAGSMPESIFAFKDDVQNYALLPKLGWSGFRIRVKGDPDQSGDEYYLRFTPASPAQDAFCNGSWEETRKLGLKDKLDAATMPHALVNYGTHFVFKPLEWGERLVGDEETSPEPSFVGKKINNLCFRSNRLGILADENVVLSETGDFYNFFRTTVIQLLDTDPIDIAVSGEGVAILKSSVATSEKLLLFSDKGQFSLEGDPLTPSTVDTPQLTSYENSSFTQPFALGNQVYFAFNRSGYTGLAEYGLQSDTGLFGSEDITEHVPRYLVGAARFIFGSNTESTLFVSTEGLVEGLYVFRFLRKNSQRLLASWSKWTFGAPLSYAFIIEDQLYLVLQRENGLVLENLDMKPGDTDEHSSFSVHLDRRVTDLGLTKVYDSGTNRTTITLPYAPTSSKFRAVKRATLTGVIPTTVVVGGGFSSGFSKGFRRSGLGGGTIIGPVEAGEQLPIVSLTGATLVVQGDHSTTPLWFGEIYDSYIDLSKPKLREQRGEGNFVVVPGRFQIRKGYIAFHNTLQFTVEVRLPGRAVSTKTYYPRYVAGITAQAGIQPTPQSGTFTFPVLSVNENAQVRIRNDGHLPSSLLSVDWEALYSHRTTRV